MHFSSINSFPFLKFKLFINLKWPIFVRFVWSHTQCGAVDVEHLEQREVRAFVCVLAMTIFLTKTAQTIFHRYTSIKSDRRKALYPAERNTPRSSQLCHKNEGERKILYGSFQRTTPLQGSRETFKVQRSN